MLKVLLALAWCWPARAQFDVVSVKPVPAQVGRYVAVPRMEGGPETKDPTRIAYRDVSLRDLITKAYDVKYVQISGPAWLNNIDFTSPADKFLIDARVPPGTTVEQFRGMLQSLLAERFNLKAHLETKEGAVYNLVVGKNGPKLPESTPAPAAPVDEEPGKLGSKGADGFYTMPPGHSGLLVNVNSSAIRIKFMRQSMAQFANWLWSQVKRPVVDRTELKGAYDFYLEHGRELNARPIDADGRTSASDPGAPDLLAALQAQLGLKLVADRGPVEMLIIDHIDRSPTGN